jgi:hypothetical protein
MLITQVSLAAYTPETVEPVERVMPENRRIMADEVSFALGISHGCACHIMHDVFQYLKMCGRWVPRQLTPELKERHMGACKELLGHCQTEWVLFFRT